MSSKRIRTILFVCTGNLCRSPMAEGILRDRIDKEGLEGMRVASAGTWGLEGEPAAKHAIKVCSDRGIDLSGHVARRLTGDMIEGSDLVLAMEMEHLQGVLDLVPNALAKTRMLSRYGAEDRRIDLVPNALAKTRMLSRYGAEDRRIDLPIRDPYGRPKQAYVTCFEELERYIDALVEELPEELS